jgi:hypothetical protein
VKILFSDRSIFDLGPSTLFKIDEYKLNNGADRKVALSMDYGKIRAAVNERLNKKGSFKLRTAGTTMGVRGTEFLVNSDIGAVSDNNGERSKTNPSGSQSNVEIKVIEGNVLATVDAAPGSKAQSQKLSLEKGQEVKINVNLGRTPASGGGQNKLDGQAKVEIKNFDVQKETQTVKQDLQINAQQIIVDGSMLGAALGSMGDSAQHEFNPQDLANSRPQGPPQPFMLPPEQNGLARVSVKISP